MEYALPKTGSLYWLQRHSPTVLGAFLLVAMGVSLAWQSAEWLRVLNSPPPPVEYTAPRPVAQVSLEKLTPLFGPDLTQPLAPPTTTLRLTLHGSFVNADPLRSSAIIQRNGDKPQRFEIGSELETGVRLHAVYADRIEIERKGRLEVLHFPSRGRAGNAPTLSSPLTAEDQAAQLDALQDDSLRQLRERLVSLRQKMNSSGTRATDAPAPIEQPTESD